VHSSQNATDLAPLKSLVSHNANPAEVCSELARLFSVRETEVAMLQVKRSFLEFVYPPELKTGGSIPLSSSAVAAQTAREKKPEIFNTFTRVKHASIFEVVKLGEQADLSDQVIQKLMSAPIVADGKSVGVVQISRKGRTPRVAGPDFTPADLTTLELCAEILVNFFAPVPSDRS